MITIVQLWVPILLSAFLVFVTSSLVHMVFKWHRFDYHKLPNEDEVRAVIRKGNPTPGQYLMPHCTDHSHMKDPAFQQKYIEGPVGLVTLMPSGLPQMGPMLGKWFVFNVFISFFAAYVSSRTLATGTDYLHVFQITGAVAWIAYGGATVPGSIWMGKPWSNTARELFDALLYGMVTGGAFGWLWPR